MTDDQALGLIYSLLALAIVVMGFQSHLAERRSEKRDRTKRKRDD